MQLFMNSENLLCLLWAKIVETVDRGIEWQITKHSNAAIFECLCVAAEEFPALAASSEPTNIAIMRLLMRLILGHAVSVNISTTSARARGNFSIYNDVQSIRIIGFEKSHFYTYYEDESQKC